MIVIVAIDDNGGMMFHQRRQSQDVVLRQRILEVSRGCKLWMNAYTAKQFEDTTQVCVSDSFLEEAGEGDFCFVENIPIAPYGERVERLLIYKWNRTYPHDTQLDIDLGDWSLLSSVKFAGKSHAEITEEVYVK